MAWTGTSGLFVAGWGVGHGVIVHVLFFRSSVGGPLNCLHLLAPVNALLWTLADKFLCGYSLHVSWVYTWERLGHMGTISLTFEGTARGVSKVAAPFPTDSHFLKDPPNGSGEEVWGREGRNGVSL